MHPAQLARIRHSSAPDAAAFFIQVLSLGNFRTGLFEYLELLNSWNNWSSYFRGEHIAIGSLYISGPSAFLGVCFEMQKLKGVELLELEKRGFRYKTPVPASDDLGASVIRMGFSHD